MTTTTMTEAVWQGPGLARFCAETQLQIRLRLRLRLPRASNGRVHVHVHVHDHVHVHVVETVVVPVCPVALWTETCRTEAGPAGPLPVS